LRRLVAFTHARDNPASRFRILQYIPHLEQAGWKVSHRPQNPSQPRQSPLRNPILKALHIRTKLILRRIYRLRDIFSSASFHAVFLNRDLLEGNVLYEKLLIRRNPRVIFDFDDSIFLGEKASHIRWICENAAWVTAGNEYLSQFAQRFTNRVTILPTVVEVENYAVKKHIPQDKPLRVGWLGSDRSIKETLFPYVEMLARLQVNLGFEFVIVSRPKPILPDSSLQWKYIEWNEIVETQISSFFDIGIMPLVDDEYQKGKCGCKILQYMAAGLPVIASPVGVNTHFVDHGKRGFLAKGEDEWHDALKTLMQNTTLYQKFGSSGRAFVKKKYSLRVWLPLLLYLLEKISVFKP